MLYCQCLSVLTQVYVSSNWCIHILTVHVKRYACYVCACVYCNVNEIYSITYDVVEAHCYTVDTLQIDLESATYVFTQYQFAQYNAIQCIPLHMVGLQYVLILLIHAGSFRVSIVRI